MMTTSVYAHSPFGPALRLRPLHLPLAKMRKYPRHTPVPWSVPTDQPVGSPVGGLLVRKTGSLREDSPLQAMAALCMAVQ